MSTIAQLADLYNVLPSNQMGTVTTQAQQSRLDAAEAWALSKLRARYNIASPPSGPFDPRLVEAICEIAAYKILVLRGFKPSLGADMNIKLRADTAEKWLDDVERQRAHPVIVEVSSPPPAYPAPLVLSQPSQGWMPPPNLPNSSSGTPQSGV